MNILILSCGTRGQLVDYFMDRKNGFDKIVTTDCSPYSPALYLADKYYIVPRMKEAAYLPELFEICENENIDMVLPLQEDELILIAENRDAFIDKNILPVISDYDVVALCRDKFNFYQKLYHKGVDSVPTYLMKDMELAVAEYGFPLFMKPRYGAGSVSSFVVHTEVMAESMAANISGEFVLQPYMAGCEYGVNVYVDFISGEIAELFILKKLRMRAGETEKSVSAHRGEIREIVQKICSLLNLRGPIDMDILEKEGKFYVLEINPRFGGGYPHAHACGVNFIKLLANNAGGKSNGSSCMPYEDGIAALRYMTILTMREGDMQDEK